MNAVRQDCNPRESFHFSSMAMFTKWQVETARWWEEDVRGGSCALATRGAMPYGSVQSLRAPSAALGL